MIPLVVATWYAGAYVGQPLYCSTPERSLYYDEQTPPWVALPVGGDWNCWDVMRLTFPNGETLTAFALDAGPFGANCVMQRDGSCAPIVADVPKHLWPVDGLSAPVQIVNVTAMYRELRDGPGVPVGFSPPPVFLLGPPDDLSIKAVMWIRE